MKKKYLYICILVVSFLFAGIQPALAQDDPLVYDPDEVEETSMAGTVQGTGTYFEVTDSSYLNIAFESSEPVNLSLDSVREMIVMDIEAAEGATSTQITLTGFLPSTTYYKYEDDYHNGVMFTTDGNGSHSYVQDLTLSHLVLIQPNAGTIFIPGDTSVGIWDDVTRTYTLTTDVYETIQIDENNLTLDGAGHTVTGTGSGLGVYLYGRSGVTIKNVSVQQFGFGIYLCRSINNTLMANTASNNEYGIRLNWCYGSDTLTENIASNNTYGIHLHNSNGITLMANTTSSNTYGIRLNWCGLMTPHKPNIMIKNTSSKNGWGIYLWACLNNQIIYNNNFIDNGTQAFVYGASGNLFNLDKPIGGNYWSNWCPPSHPDDDGDGFVDEAYFFYGGVDYLPLASPHVWKLLVEIDIKPGSDPNSINLGEHGLLPVAILGSMEFDVTTINPETIAIGGITLAYRGSNKAPKLAYSLEDVNGDGFADMMTFFDVQELVSLEVLTGETIELLLTAALDDETPIEGTDSVNIIH